MPFISPDDSFALWGALFVIVVLGLLAERHSKIGRRLTGAVIIILTGTAASNLGVIPTAAPAYDVVWGQGVPIAVCLLLFDADLRRIFRESGRVLIAFGIGAIGTVAGVFTGLAFVDLGPDSAALSGIFAATYIGGSVNFAAVAEATGFRESDALSAAVAADNLAGTFLLAALVALPSLKFIADRFVVASDAVREGGTDPADAPQSVTPLSLAIALALAFTIVAVSKFGSAALGLGTYSILFTTVITLLLATYARPLIAKAAGAFQLGMLTMFVFFVVIGAGADIGAMLAKGQTLFAFAAILLAVHLVVVLVLGKIAKLELSELMVGSNACILGAATAAAMAGTMGWRGLVTPGILAGTLGYAVANFVGLGLFSALQ
ncbi:MAG: DUF819 domain-containing protein [Alphaproteobacteria bacterium]